MTTTVTSTTPHAIGTTFQVTPVSADALAAGAPASVGVLPRHSPVLAARVWRAGTGAAGTGVLVLYGYGSVVTALMGPISAGDPGAASAQPITAINFAVGTLVCTLWGTVLAVVLGRFSIRPARAFIRAAVGLLLVSLAAPLAASHTTTGTRLALAAAHLLAAAVVVPILTRALRH